MNENKNKYRSLYCTVTVRVSHPKSSYTHLMCVRLRLRNSETNQAVFVARHTEAMCVTSASSQSVDFLCEMEQDVGIKNIQL